MVILSDTLPVKKLKSKKLYPETVSYISQKENSHISVRTLTKRKIFYIPYTLR